jgi:hypothetical protein
MISGRHSGRLVLISGEQRDNFGTKMVPVYAARIEDLGPGDFVKVDCTACSHRALLAPVFLDRLGLDLTINGQNATDGTLKKLEFLRVSKRRAEKRERIPLFSEAYSLTCRTIAAIGFRVDRSSSWSTCSTVAQTCW